MAARKLHPAAEAVARVGVRALEEGFGAFVDSLLGEVEEASEEIVRRTKRARSRIRERKTKRGGHGG